jgi:hypothetical protein
MWIDDRGRWLSFSYVQPCLLDCRSDRLGITGLTVPGVDRDLHAYKIMRIKDDSEFYNYTTVQEAEQDLCPRILWCAPHEHPGFYRIDTRGL